jgi:hypothetical protein
MRPDELQTMRSNWKLVTEVQGKVEKALLGRLLSKTKEIKSLRDGE